jgi:hypothetical protein
VQEAPLGATPPKPGERRQRLTESVLDNLVAWAFIAGVIAILYETWATLRILTKYVGQLPGVSP